MKRKLIYKNTPLVYPAPAMLVSCGNNPDNYNIITISWTGTINSEPPMCSISIRPERYSHELISQSGEFVLNLCTESLAKAADYCGMKTGSKVNKFKEMNLTPVKGLKVSAPCILESPVSIECKVRQIIKLGSHDMFIADILQVHVNEDLLKENSYGIDLSLANLVCYFGGSYYKVGSEIGKQGFSIREKSID